MNAPSTALHVREFGQPGSPAVVFLHATGASGGMWEQHLRRLGGLPLPGAGPSRARAQQPPAWRSRIDTAEQVARLIQDRIPSRRARVVGLSLGGAVAHTLLARRRELLDRVVIDGCGACGRGGSGQ